MKVIRPLCGIFHPRELYVSIFNSQSGFDGIQCTPENVAGKINRPNIFKSTANFNGPRLKRSPFPPSCCDFLKLL